MAMMRMSWMFLLGNKCRSIFRKTVAMRLDKVEKRSFEGLAGGSGGLNFGFELAFNGQNGGLFGFDLALFGFVLGSFFNDRQ
jgi:hypothetical protein